MFAIQDPTRKCAHSFSLVNLRISASPIAHLRRRRWRPLCRKRRARPTTRARSSSSPSFLPAPKVRLRLSFALWISNCSSSRDWLASERSTDSSDMTGCAYVVCSRRPGAAEKDGGADPGQRLGRERQRGAHGLQGCAQALGAALRGRAGPPQGHHVHRRRRPRVRLLAGHPFSI